MRIYNARKVQIEMPLGNGSKLIVPSNSVSCEFMPNATIISVFMTSYRSSEIAFIVSGPYEIAMLSNFVGSGDFVVQSLEQAIAKFAPKVDPTTTTAAPIVIEEKTTTPEPKKEEEVTTTTEAPVIEEVPNEETTEAPVVEQPKKKVVSSTAKKAEKPEA